jgi:hypothetical protein
MRMAQFLATSSGNVERLTLFPFPLQTPTDRLFRSHIMAPIALDSVDGESSLRM